MCVAADAVTCREAGSSTYYYDSTDGCVTACTVGGGRTLTRNSAMGNACVTDVNCRGMAHTGTTRGAVMSTQCVVASADACNGDGARAFNNAGTACVASCITNDGGRGRDSAHNCVAAYGFILSLGGGQ